MVFIGVSRASRIDGNDDDDEEWSHMFVRLPPLPTDDDDDDSVAEGRSQPPDASAIEALFERGGPLHGKSMKARVAIASVGPRPGDYSIWPRRAFLPLPRRHAREKMFLVALVQALGFPDVARGFQTCLGASTERLYPDAVYESLKIAFECDEEQHYDDAHWFNRSKPDYHQRRRDRAVNVGYASQGYYVVRVMACDRRSRGRRYVPCSPVEVYARAAFAARQAVAIRERNYAAGDYAGKLLLVGALKDPRSVSEEQFDKSRVEAEAAKCAIPPADLRRAQRLASDALQRRPALVPPTAPSAADGSCTGHASAYERRWRSLLDGYAPRERYNERVKRIDDQLKRTDARP